MSKKVVIDWDRVSDLLRAGCSGVGISGLLGIHENTLYLRCQKELRMDFVALRQQKVAEGNSLLEEKQFKAAMEGDRTMLIWLGKQRLNQTDKSDSTQTIRQVNVDWVDSNEEYLTNDGDSTTSDSIH